VTPQAATPLRRNRWPGSLFCGAGAALEAAAELRRLGAARPAVLLDPNVNGSEAVGELRGSLRAAGFEAAEMAAPAAEPAMGDVLPYAGFLRDGGHDAVIAVGGGSCLDVAKLAAVLAVHEGRVQDFAGIDRVPGKGLPLIAVPTTAGTGSESTAVAIFADDETSVKQGVVSEHLRPDVALVDPVLTLSCPPTATAAAGIDAFIHCVESFLSRNATAVSRPLARDGIRLAARWLVAAVENGGDLEARTGMAEASMLGGLAFGISGVAAVHALSLPIGGLYHVPHGIANALLLPYVMEYNLDAARDDLAEIAAMMGEPVDGVEHRRAAELAVLAIRRLVVESGGPATFADVGVPEDALPELVAGAVGQTRLLGANPRALDAPEIEAIYRNAVRGELEIVSE